MKGLLIKDFLLLKGQKKFYFSVLLMGIFVAAATKNHSILIGYLLIILPMFSLSSISYDEYDNGFSHLFTLPITKRGYVWEKYTFTLLLGITAWILAVGIGVLFRLFSPTSTFGELILTTVAVLILTLLFQSVMLPLQIKFGAEKGRVAMLVVIGLLAPIGYGISRLGTQYGEQLEHVNPPLLFVIAVGGLIGIWFASVKISILILEKKEL